MKYEIENTLYNVIIKRKNNKNTYIRVDENKNIIVTTNYFVTTNKIKQILDNNINFLKKNLAKEKKEGFYLMGKKYDIIIDEKIKNIEIDEITIKVKDEKKLNNWYKKEISRIFKEHLDFYYNKFEENIPYPTLKIRAMKTRWGVCNRKIKSVTLNLNLVKYDSTCLDYVIVHELSHFVHFNHSKAFWNIVEKYYPNYKEIEKKLKNWQNIY